jgi:hypothetical protein
MHTRVWESGLVSSFDTRNTSLDTSIVTDKRASRRFSLRRQNPGLALLCCQITGSDDPIIWNSSPTPSPPPLAGIFDLKREGGKVPLFPREGFRVSSILMEIIATQLPLLRFRILPLPLSTSVERGNKGVR